MPFRQQIASNLIIVVSEIANWVSTSDKFSFQKYEINKRAQRALGRSPEEKVKGHSGAIYRVPLMIYTKYESSSVWDKNIFENCILKTYFFDPVTYLCNKSEPFEQFW